jgi:dipeptide/tripeptide permease
MSASASASPRSSLREDLRALRGRPTALWGIYALKLLESVAFFAAYNVLVVYLSEELHYTDKQAGAIAGTWLTAVSLVTFASGAIADSAGIRKALLASVLSCLAGRVVLAFAHERTSALVGLALMSYGVGAMFPTMAAGVRRFTDERTVSFGFSLYYVVMNLGAFTAGPLVSTVRRRIARPIHGSIAGIDLHFSSGQVIYLASALVTLVGLFVTLKFIRNDLPAPETTNETASATPARPKKGALGILSEVVRERTFWRFLLFVSLLVLVRLIFQHAHLTWPKYTLREFGREFPYATYWSINPLMIIALTPVVTALTRHRSAYSVIVWGAFITTASVFFLALSTTVTASVLFIVTLSLGEALWSPRLYEFTARVAPKGREGTYTGLAQIPMFVAKPIVGFVSGALLSRYCPPDGARDSKTLWLVVGLSTLVGPVLIVLLRRVIEGPAVKRTHERTA